MIWGETECNGVPVLNTSWSRRNLWRVEGYTEGGETVHVYVWDDCEGDAVESVLEWAGEEGSDDSNLSVFRVRGDEYDQIRKASDKHQSSL